jgi:hypothetical protein
VQDGLITMAAFLGTERSNVDVDLVVLMAHLQAACKQIATVLASPRELQQESSSPYGTQPFGPSFGDDPRPMITISVGVSGGLSCLNNMPRSCNIICIVEFDFEHGLSFLQL